MNVSNISDVIDSRIIFHGGDSSHIGDTIITQNITVSENRIVGVKLVYWISGTNKGKISLFNSVIGWSDRELIITFNYLKEEN